MNSEVSNERFILSENNYSYKELFTMMANAFGKKPPYKKVTPFIASVVWRLEGIKSRFKGTDPLLTKETSNTAQAKVNFDNSKLLKQFPGFKYNSLQSSIERIVRELKEKYQLG
jgi:dihydroflavonol-4-reductase